MVALQMMVLSLALAGPGEPVLLDFTAAWCGPCRQMEPVVQQLSLAGYNVRQIDIDRQPELKQQFKITGIPCFVLVVDGREVDRITGSTSAAQLQQMFDRANIQRSASPGQAALNNAQQITQQAFATAQAAQHAATAQTPAIPSAATTPIDANQIAYRNDDGLVDRLMASSVRLRINDSNGKSVGSGTIIDARAGEALIVTCGHVFRSSKGKGSIEVDLLAPGAPQRLPARLVGFSLENDIGFLSIRPGCAVQPVTLADASHRSAKDEPVISIGCDHGGPGSARLTRITSINKFLGPANLQTAGQPVQGRSGGGLFSSDGLLIGVCNAADPQDNEGLFAALPTIHTELARLGIDQVLATVASDEPSLSAERSREAVAETSHNVAGQTAEPATTTSDSRGPKAVVIRASTTKSATKKTLANAAPAGAAIPAVEAALAPHEQALIEQLQARGEGAEVICIVRSLHDPRAKSEIIVLDRASPQLLDQLSAESRRQPAQNLTSASVSASKVTR